MVVVTVGIPRCLSFRLPEKKRYIFERGYLTTADKYPLFERGYLSAVVLCLLLYVARAKREGRPVFLGRKKRQERAATRML